MKKNLLFFSLVALCAGANAQEVGQVDAISAGLTKDLSESTIENVELAKTENASLTTGSADQYKLMTAHVDNYRFIVFNGTDTLSLAEQGNGLTGNTNGAKSGQYNGCQYIFTSNIDGYAYFAIKANACKNYFIKEFAGDPTAATTTFADMAYTFSMKTDSKFTGLFDDDMITYSLAADEDGYYDGEGDILTPADYYYGSVEKTAEVVAKETAEGGILAKEKKTKMDVNGVCVMSCRVVEGGKYLIYCTGSKMTIAGYALSAEPMTVVACGDEKTAEDGTVTPACSAELKSVEKVASDNANALKNIKSNKAAKKAAFKTLKNGKMVVVNDGVDYALDGKIVK